MVPNFPLDTLMSRSNEVKLLKCIAALESLGLGALGAKWRLNRNNTFSVFEWCVSLMSTYLSLMSSSLYSQDSPEMPRRPNIPHVWSHSPQSDQRSAVLAASVLNSQLRQVNCHCFVLALTARMHVCILGLASRVSGKKTCSLLGDVDTERP